MERPEAVIGFGIQLSTLRALARVGNALSRKYPTEESWQDFLNSREFFETSHEIAQLIQDIQQTLASSPEAAPELIHEIMKEQYAPALQAIQDLAGLVEVDATDLLAVVVNP